MITQNDTANLPGANVYDTDGDKIGSVGQVYLDAQTGNPEWLTVKTGLFGTKETFVPLRDATISDDRVTVAYAKDQVKGAPNIEADGPMSHSEEDELYTYYGLSGAGGDGDGYRNDTYQSGSSDQGGSGYQSGSSYQGDADYTSRDTAASGGGDTGGDAMTRSEERLVAGTRTEQAGKARLRKYVVTEQQQVNVPVSREEVRLEREPITDANAGDAYNGPEITEAEHEVTLRAERPVVETEAVPVERVRLGKETVRDEETVSGEVRKEQIDFDSPQGSNRR
jgi:uncharacterized protein (TIGR02271 family)